MKRILILAVLITLSTIATFGQSTTNFTITVVAPPSCVVTLAANPVSTSGTQLYAGQAGTLNFNVSACSIASVSTAKATWDGANLTVVAPFAVSISAAQATAGTHAVVLTIPLPVLSMNDPIQLPNVTLGQSYSADLSSLIQLQKDGVSCTTCSFSATSSLPSGLTLSPNGIVSGTPSGVGSFTYTVTDTAPNMAQFKSVSLWAWTTIKSQKVIRTIQ